MNILFVIGTRPEAIKVAPLLKRLIDDSYFNVKLCNTGQHIDLLDPILDFFKLECDYNLKVMTNGQTLGSLTGLILNGLDNIFLKFKPDLIIVHGDTTTSFAAALSAFYNNIKVAHLEAGLRSHNKLAPFPEEINRSLTSKIADYHFAPTESSKNNLFREGVLNNVLVTGNTVIDALYDAIELVDEMDPTIVDLKSKIQFNEKKVILFTGHRRENFGGGFEEIFSAIDYLSSVRNDILFVYPVHPNPNVKNLAEEKFKNNENVLLIEPLIYGQFVWLLKNVYIILTDSGGIQEEAPSLGIPVLVLREQTERPEAVEAGTVKLVGTNKNLIIEEVNKLLDNKEYFNQISCVINPYGDGNASNRVIEFLKLI
ncbi:non-hydrolyzing UDP-N-acetylglucosamine 2-epimerase [Aquirufa antheringensis]